MVRIARGATRRAVSVAPDGRMPLIEHLRELRNRLAKSLLAITVGIVISFLFWEQILDFLRQPYCRSTASANCDLFAFTPLETFAIQLKTSSIGGVVLTAPIWLYQLGAFITPALHRKERRYAMAFVVVSTLLFAAGCVTAYLTLDRGLDFLLNVGGSDIEVLLSLKSYLNFVTLTLLSFGIAFLFPVVLVFLNVVGVLPTDRMRAWRRGMIVAIAVLAAVLTPSTDPYTFTFMAVPLYVLYEVCILIGRLRDRMGRRQREQDPVAQLGDDETSVLEPATPTPAASDDDLDPAEQPRRASLQG